MILGVAVAIRHGNLEKLGNATDSGGREEYCAPQEATGVTSRTMAQTHLCAQCSVAGQFQIIHHHSRQAIQPENLFAHRFMFFLTLWELHYK